MLIFLYVFIFSNIVPLLGPIGFLYFLFKHYHDTIMIFYYYKKSKDMDGFALRQNVKSLLFYIALFPVFYLLIMSKFYGIPYFAFGGFLVLVVGFFIILFIYLHRKIKYQQRIVASGSYNLFSVPVDEIKNEYRHPLYEYYRTPEVSLLRRIANSDSDIVMINE
jgi:hypothetical protein